MEFDAVGVLVGSFVKLWWLVAIFVFVTFVRSLTAPVFDGGANAAAPIFTIGCHIGLP